MKGAFVAILLVATLFSFCRGQGMFGANWMGPFFNNINQMHRKLQGNMELMNQQIQQSVHSNMQQIGSIGQHTMTIGTNGQSVVVTGSSGGSKSVVSGQNANGEPFFRESEDKIIGDTLLHTDKVYNPSRKSVDEFKYTLDLKNPDAKPVPINTN